MIVGPERGIAVGVAEQANSVVLVTLGPGGELLDRRRVELTAPELPTHPHHREGSWAVGRYSRTPGARTIPLADAVALVGRVAAAAARGAEDALAGLAAAIPLPIECIAIRSIPAMPPTIEERIIDNRAQAMADSAMYRQALADAATARGWSVHWYDRELVFSEAAAVLGVDDIERFLSEMGRQVGPPWQAKHKLAAVAAIAAAGRLIGSSPSRDEGGR